MMLETDHKMYLERLQEAPKHFELTYFKAAGTKFLKSSSVSEEFYLKQVFLISRTVEEIHSPPFHAEVMILWSCTSAPQ
jgi:hypothetical protein